ncbi:uncharacterized protein LOC117508250 isoform X2 [Thalassophryne amazonica]|uniref:uncharacterized protein LOC117508250 isoform X2 n=1 Tax=Thalassophryne amazonica TaxID=390379 RepID=UPI001471F87D|nr:uncharacterized protein LOC117508250 isoform X2 [Thalassophryne amazonica]
MAEDVIKGGQAQKDEGVFDFFKKKKGDGKDGKSDKGGKSDKDGKSDKGGKSDKSSEDGKKKKKTRGRRRRVVGVQIHPAVTLTEGQKEAHVDFFFFFFFFA